VDLEDSFEDVEEKFGERICAYHRVDLHRGLRELVEAAGVEIRLGCEVVDVVPEKGEFGIRGGERITADFMVLADGCHVSLFELYHSGPSGAFLELWKAADFRLMINRQSSFPR
jgi:flavin-dependent dehydrogenase